MTETVKKTTTRKPKVQAAVAAKTETAAPKAQKATAKTNGKLNGKHDIPAHLDNLTVVHPSKEQIAALAHRYWAERGYQHGQDADDWFRAEQELRSKAS
jgi:hypothetical protein